MIFRNLKNMLTTCKDISPRQDPNVSKGQYDTVSTKKPPKRKKSVAPKKDQLENAIDLLKRSVYHCVCFTISKNNAEVLDQHYIYTIIKDRKDLDGLFKDTRDVRIKEITVYKNLNVFPYGGRFLFSVTCNKDRCLYDVPTPSFVIANSAAEAYWACSHIIPENVYFSISVVSAFDMSGDFPEICLYNTVPEFGL